MNEIGCDICGKWTTEDDGNWFNNGKHPHDPDCVSGFACNECIEKEAPQE